MAYWKLCCTGQQPNVIYHRMLANWGRTGCLQETREVLPTHRQDHGDVRDNAGIADVVHQALLGQTNRHALEEEDHGSLEAPDKRRVRVPSDELLLGTFDELRNFGFAEC